MKPVGLKFLLDGFSFVQIVLKEEEAKQIVLGYIAGSLKPIIGGTENTLGGGVWAVQTSVIRAIHSVPVEPVAGAPSQPIWNRSGF